MYYEPYQKKNPARRSRRRGRSPGAWLAEFFLRLLAALIALALAAAGILYALPVSLFAVEPEGVILSPADDLPLNRANVLLLGLDALHENTRRSDAILIATVGYGTLRLTSVLRDTVVNIPGHGPGKLNAAYAYGGPELVMRTLNENFRLNLLHYVAVDYAALAEAVDALGGADVELTDREAAAVNALIADYAAQLTAKGRAAAPVTLADGVAHLNGTQALAYVRIRKLDSDFGRANRQRKLLGALLRRLRASLWNPARLARLFRTLHASCDTNLSPVQLLSLGEKALAADAPPTLRLPVDGAYEDDGARINVTDYPANAAAFRAFAYGDQASGTAGGQGDR